MGLARIGRIAPFDTLNRANIVVICQPEPAASSTLKSLVKLGLAFDAPGFCVG